MRGEANGGEDRREPRGEDREHDDEGEERQRQPQEQRPTPRPSSGPQPQPQHQPTPPVMMRNVGYVGKHRLSAAIARLDQELQSLQVCTLLFFAASHQPNHRGSSSTIESTCPTCCRSSANERVIQILQTAWKLPNFWHPIYSPNYALSILLEH